MLSLRKSRRALALFATSLTLAGGTALAGAGSAHAGSAICASSYVRFGWTLKSCVENIGGEIVGWVTATAPAGSTDVRIYAQLWNNCGVNGWHPAGSATPDTSVNHAYPTAASADAGSTGVSNGCQWSTLSWLTDNGNLYEPTVDSGNTY